MLETTSMMDRSKEIALVYMYECGNVDRVLIRETGIYYAEPLGWKAVERLRDHNGWDKCIPIMDLHSNT